MTLRMVARNAVTAMALCFGLTGVRYGISGEWERAVLSILIAGVLDGLDGRIARLLRGESRFGAELDSLSDSIAFGVAPALVLYLWSLHAMPRSEEHTSELQSLMRISYAVFCLKKKKK